MQLLFDHFLGLHGVEVLNELQSVLNLKELESVDGGLGPAVIDELDEGVVDRLGYGREPVFISLAVFVFGDGHSVALTANVPDGLHVNLNV